MVRSLVILLVTFGALAQSPPPDLNTMLHDVRSAIGNSDLVTASDLAANIDDGVQAHLQAWMVRDARQRVAEVLTWLPAGTETLLVDQEPFVIGNTAGRPDAVYVLGRLSSIGALRGRIVRIAAAGEMDIRDRAGAPLRIPATMPAAGIVCFYFLGENLDTYSLGAREPQDMAGRPVWHAAARPRSRDEDLWMALARPDLLVAANSRELLADEMDRIVKGSTARALPASLAEWAEVDRNSPVWALRHYPDAGDRHDASNPRMSGSRLFQTDASASGIAVNFDPGPQALAIHYLSHADRLGIYIEQMFNREFQVDRSKPGVWRLRSNLRERGEFPFHLAMAMLGLGSAQ
jgi:hypothetical protein